MKTALRILAVTLPLSGAIAIGIVLSRTTFEPVPVTFGPWETPPVAARRGEVLDATLTFTAHQLPVCINATGVWVQASDGTLWRQPAGRRIAGGKVTYRIVIPPDIATGPATMWGVDDYGCALATIRAKTPVLRVVIGG